MCSYLCPFIKFETSYSYKEDELRVNLGAPKLEVRLLQAAPAVV